MTQNNKTTLVESAGGIVFYVADFNINVALVKKNTGQWVLPKGRLEKNEKAEDTALREVNEELGVNIKMKPYCFLGTNEYSFTLKDSSDFHSKKVHYFLYLFDRNLDLKPLGEENFVEAKWFNYYEALNKLTYESDKEFLLRAKDEYSLQRKIEPVPDNPTISFCLPVHNGAQTIKKTVDSLTDQIKSLDDKYHFEILICLDHCTDRTQEKCEEIKQKYQQYEIRIIINENQKGICSAENLLAQKAGGDILLFLDDDMTMQGNINELFDEFIEKQETIKILYPKSVPNQKTNKFWLNSYCWKILSLKFRKDIYINSDPFFVGRCFVMNRNTWINFPDSPLFIDDISLQLSYHPMLLKSDKVKVYFNSVSNFRDYLRRFIRLSYGKEITKSFFSKKRLAECADIKRIIDYQKIKNLGFADKHYYYMYKLSRWLALIIYKIHKLFFKKSYEWKRIKQN